MSWNPLNLFKKNPEQAICKHDWEELESPEYHVMVETIQESVGEKNYNPYMLGERLAYNRVEKKVCLLCETYKDNYDDFIKREINRVLEEVKIREERQQQAKEILERQSQ
jgi:hypothetical protein